MSVCQYVSMSVCQYVSMSVCQYVSQQESAISRKIHPVFRWRCTRGYGIGRARGTQHRIAQRARRERMTLLIDARNDIPESANTPRPPLPSLRCGRGSDISSLTH
jgi:hypothetical protein